MRDLMFQNYLKVLERKYLVVDNEEEPDVEGEETSDMPRNNILLAKLPMPKLVRPPNGGTFYEKYAKVLRNQLPQHV